MNEQADVSQYLGLWSIEPTRGQALAQSLRSMDWKAHFAASAEKMASGTLDGQDRPYRVQNGVAVINIAGVMTKGGSSLSDGGSTVRIRQQLRRAAKDDQVSSIMLVIDSPGGTVAGTADLAAEVQKANAQKPVLAFVEDLCASAAYFVASQASEIHANAETAIVGSIGTYMVAYDLSGAFEKQGIKAHVLATGPLKGAGVMGSEITDAQLENWQTLINNSQKPFAAAVKGGRKLNAEQLAAVSSGGVWTAKDAVKNQLIDAISSFDDVLALASGASKKKGRTMSAEKDDAPRGASLAELKTIGASAEFVVQQLEKSATLAEAKNAWLDQRMAALDKRDEEMKAKADALDKRETALAEKEKKATQKNGVGLPTVKDPAAKAGDGSSDEGDGSAQSQLETIVAAKIKAGVPRAKAWPDAVRENKELHQQMLDEAPRVERRRRA